ncbi:MAG: hypothetical protein ACJ8GN_19330 [Longimicrobiaceae bacterium]
MKKMALDLDALVVESFETDIPQERGTVLGAERPPGGGGTYPYCSEIDACPSALGCTFYDNCTKEFCGEDTLAISCGGTCDLNCPSDLC